MGFRIPSEVLSSRPNVTEGRYNTLPAVPSSPRRYLQRKVRTFVSQSPHYFNSAPLIQCFHEH